ncbi:signal peptide peptidase SppA [Candidatus Micrarchaeota archaeon]|nr:signal peptide peptidase SppA [Candidatus Micrarchaeota archaeon]
MDLLKLVLVFVVLAVFAGVLAVGVQSAVQSSCVSVLDVHGVITLDGEASFFSAQPGSRALVEQIKNWQESSSPVLFLDINSPGGSAVASKEIYDALSESEKPVVAYLGEIAASGGYYVAAGSDFVIANPNTITGSIGAITDVVNYQGLLDKLGVTQEAIKSGQLKDIGAGYRNLTAQERLLLQGLIDETFQNFKADVEKGRQAKLTAFYQETLDARILSASQAQKAGLVDAIGSRQSALQKAAELGGLNAESVTECPLQAESGFGDVFASAGSSFAQGMLRELSAPSALRATT